MKYTISHLTTCVMLGLLLTTAASETALAQKQPHAYPNMVPVAQYMMNRDAEIALARSAAPASISGQATVLVLGSHGYVTAVAGKNGFVCAVERSWMSQFDSPEFWNPHMRGPVCFNPQAVQSILPFTYKRAELALAGQSKDQIEKAIDTALASKQLPPLVPGAMSYMMSKDGYLNDEAVHWIPHLMMYTALNADWGADRSGSPVMLNPQFQKPEKIDVFLIPTGKWSDGTAAPAMDH